MISKSQQNKIIREAGKLMRRSNTIMKVVVIVVILAIVGVYLWFGTHQDSSNPTAKPVELTPPASVSEVTATLNNLTVAEKVEENYDRSVFGTAWKDVDENGCDTRNDILQRDLTELVFEDTKNCVITSGTLDDPYTGKIIHFVKGHGSLVDIDHVVALGEAVRSGALQLSQEDRLQFANDPDNLLAVDAGANRSKGDKDAGEWLPTNESFHCTYAKMQINVKAEYELSISEPEKLGLTNALATCPE